jgi:hypothetical protein
MRMVFALFAVFALLITGCTKGEDAGCAVAKTASSLVAAQVSTTLSCKNLDAVKEDIDAQISKTKICDQNTAQGPVGEMVCPMAVSAVMGGALKAIPAKWECSGGMPAEKLQELLLTQCKKGI